MLGGRDGTESKLAPAPKITISMTRYTLPYQEFSCHHPDAARLRLHGRHYLPTFGVSLTLGHNDFQPGLLQPRSPRTYWRTSTQTTTPVEGDSACLTWPPSGITARPVW